MLQTLLNMRMCTREEGEGVPELGHGHCHLQHWSEVTLGRAAQHHSGPEEAAGGHVRGHLQRGFVSQISQYPHLPLSPVQSVFWGYFRAQQEGSENPLLNTKSSWSSLTVYSYNIVVHFYNKKFHVKTCDTLLKISIEAGENLVKIDPSQSSSLRTRVKLRADLLFYKQKQYKESLQMLAQSLACLLMSDRETEESVQEKLTEASLFWRTVKRDWMMENVEEANAANM